MAHKLFLLLLALLLLLAFPGCKASEPPPSSNPGELYTADGLQQNTLVCLAVKTDALTAPVYTLDVTLYNNTDYPLHIKPYGGKNNDLDLLLEKFEDGTWVTAPIREGRSTLGNYNGITYDAGKNIDITLRFQEQENDPKTGEPIGSVAYLPLSPGVYRVRQECTLMLADTGVEPPKFDAVAYFIVTAE